MSIQQSIELRTGRRGGTDSIGSDGDGSPLQESIGLAACQFARDLVMIQQSRVEEGVEIVGKRPDSIGSEGDGLPRQESIGLAACQFARDLVNIQHSRVPEKGVEKSANGLHRIRWRQVAVVPVHQTGRLSVRTRVGKYRYTAK